MRSAIIALSIVYLFSCEKKDSKATEDVSGVNSGTLALEFDSDTSPTESLNIVQVALQSVPESPTGEVLSGSLAIDAGLRLDSGYQDEFCDGNGSPIARTGEDKRDDTDELAINNKNWPARHLYCLLKVGTSPETMIGSLVINKGVLCALEKAGALAEDKDGVEQSLTLEVDTECFSEDFVEQMKNEGKDKESKLTADAVTIQVKATVKKLEGDENWDQEIKLEHEGNRAETYRFRNTAEVLSGMRVESTEGGMDSGYVYSITGTGVVRFENRLIGPSSSDPEADGFTGRKHIRILVEGELNEETFALKTVDRYEAISTSEFGSGTLASVKGNADAGLWISGKYCQSENADCTDYASYQESMNACHKEDACIDNIGLQFDSAERFKFTMHGFENDSDVTDMSEFLSSVALPLAYESVTFDDIP